MKSTKSTPDRDHECKQKSRSTPRKVNSLMCENLNLESGSVPNCRGIEIVIFVILNLESGTLFLHEIGNVEHCFVMNEVGIRSPELRLCVICSKFRALAQRGHGLS